MEQIEIAINPGLYHLETIYSAAYVFLDRAYIELDGDPDKEIIVKLSSKDGGDLQRLRGDFLNELINYADYKSRAEQTRKIREMLLQRAIITNDPSVLENKEDEDSEIDDEEFEKLMKELEDEDDDDDDDVFDDPEGIAIPWEEKYGEDAEDEGRNILLEEESKEEASEKDNDHKKGEDAGKEDYIEIKCEEEIIEKENDVGVPEEKKDRSSQDPKLHSYQGKAPSIDELRNRRK